MAKFCVGLPQVRVRDLTLNELELIRREMRGRLAFSRIIWALMPVVMVAWLMGIASLPGEEVTPPKFMGMILGLAILGYGAAKAREAGRRGRRLRQDLLKGTVLVFEGVPTYEAGDLSQAWLVKEGLFRAAHEDLAGTHTVDVLETANCVFFVDGIRVESWLTANLIEIGTRTETDANYPRQFAPIEMRMREGIRRRALSEGEKAELNRMWGRTVLAIVTLMGMTLYLAVIGFAYVAFPRPYPPPPEFFVLSAFVGVVDALLISILPGTLKCRADAQNGVVLILEVPGGGRFDQGDFVQGHLLAVEALPLSGRVWTVEGHPAQWRRQVARQSTR